MAYHFTLPEEPGSFKKHFDTKAHS
jgi:hypothetical protein